MYLVLVGGHEGANVEHELVAEAGPVQRRVTRLRRVHARQVPGVRQHLCEYA